MRIFFFTILITLLFGAVPAFAAEAGEFRPLAPIPNLDTGQDATLGSYINSVFFLVISIAAMLAVLRIVLGGFQYMTQEAVSQQQQARQTIQNAVVGLLLLLGVYLILTTINPEILNFNALRSSLSGVAEKTTSQTPAVPRSDPGQVSRDLRAGEEVLEMRDGGFGAEVERAVRDLTDSDCSTPSGSDCSELLYPKINVDYRTNFVLFTYQNLSDPNDPSYGETVTKRVGYESIKQQACARAAAAGQSIPQCAS